VRRRLCACLPGLVVDGVVVNDPVVSVQTGAELRDALHGRRVVALRRRGKYLIVELDGVLLVVHLRMTGRLLLAPEPGGRPPRFVLRLRPASELLFYDTRRFGRVWALPAAAEDEFFAAMGPEPFGESFTTDYLRDALEGRVASLKSFLLDQRRIAGVGNIYADEAAFRARLNPLRVAGSLGPGEAGRLRDALVETLQLGIDHEGASIESFVDPAGSRGAFQEILNVYGRGGEPCRVCGTPVRRVELGGRGTHFCPQCQPLPRGRRLAAGGREALERERARRPGPRRAATPARGRAGRTGPRGGVDDHSGRGSA
jgi:formamidopyrimidine-DNA glycosylase